MHPLLSQRVRLGVHFPNCSCPVSGRVFDYQLRDISNGKPLHVYRYGFRCCGTTGQSPVKRTSISPAKWRELCEETRRVGV